MRGVWAIGMVGLMLAGCSGKPDTSADMERGEAARKAGDDDLAIACFDRVIRVDPACAKAWALRGSCKALSGDHQSAIRDGSEAIRLEPNNGDWLCHRAMTYIISKRLDDAESDASRAESLEPSAFAKAVLAHVYMSRDQYDTAIAKARAAVSDSPDHVYARRILAESLARKARRIYTPANRNESISLLKEAIQTWPDSNFRERFVSGCEDDIRRYSEGT